MSSPLSRVMKPNPLRELNHFTTPSSRAESKYWRYLGEDFFTFLFLERDRRLLVFFVSVSFPLRYVTEKTKALQHSKMDNRDCSDFAKGKR